MRYLILLLFTLSFISCGPLNTINTNNSDGIYGNKAEIASNNGAFYKNYFEQKSDELGINTSINDSILTDVNSYSSNTNIAYNSNGSWGDNPSSVNIIFRDRYIYSPYMDNYSYGYNGYNNYYMSSWSNPYNYWNRWNYSPWGFNYPGYGYGYGNRYGYGMWNNWWHPYYNGPDYSDPYYSRNRYSGVSYMNGRRSSLNSTDNGIIENSSNSKSVTNYNVGRNETKIVKSETGEKSEKIDQIKNRNINRVYYALKNAQGGGAPARGYQNRGEILNNGNSSSDNNSRSSKPNFQTTKYGSKTRSYNVSRSSKGSLNNSKGYSRSGLNNSNSSSSNSRSYSRPESSSSSSNKPKSSYTPPSSSSSSSRSSVGSVSRSSTSSSGGVSRGKR